MDHFQAAKQEIGIYALRNMLPSNYGYVVLVASGGTFLNMYLVNNVMNARKAYNVQYPALYSTENETFNCIQRAHQNYLENYPFFITSLMVGGLQHPRGTAVAGLVWLIGRVLYAQGYSTGEPKNREAGAIPSMLAGLFLTGNMVWMGIVHCGLYSYVRDVVGK